MTTHKLLLLPGDGIGPDVMTEVKSVLAWIEKAGLAGFELEEDLVGGAAFDAHGKAISDDAMDLAQAADAVLFGAVGGPKWDDVPYDVRPEAGLLRLRKDMELFANLRPAICYGALAASISASPRKSSILATASSAASIPRSMILTKLNALRASPSTWPEPATARSLPWKNATS